MLHDSKSTYKSIEKCIVLTQTKILFYVVIYIDLEYINSAADIFMNPQKFSRSDTKK